MKKPILSLLVLTLSTYGLLAQSNPSTIDQPDTQARLYDCPEHDPEARQRCTVTTLARFFATHLNSELLPYSEISEGELVATFEIHSNGNMVGVQLEAPLDPVLDQEVIRVFKLAQTELQWVPASHEGQTVPTKVQFPIAFR